MWSSISSSAANILPINNQFSQLGWSTSSVDWFVPFYLLMRYLLGNLATMVYRMSTMFATRTRATCEQS